MFHFDFYQYNCKKYLTVKTSSEIAKNDFSKVFTFYAHPLMSLTISFFLSFFSFFLSELIYSSPDVAHPPACAGEELDVFQQNSKNLPPSTRSTSTSMS